MVDSYIKASNTEYNDWFGVSVSLSGDTLAVVGVSAIHLLDTQTNSKRAELKLKKLQGLFLSPDGRHALALAEKQVLCLDGATGQVTARLAGFVTPTQVLFDDTTVGIGATHLSEESGR